MRARTNSDHEATQDFAVRTVLIHHCGKTLSHDMVEQIGREIIAEMRTGPCSWAFKPPEIVTQARKGRGK